jgi:AcrR family transcriptional regulator
MPKVGMGPIRREQICRAAASVIARRGFPGTTMRMVAEEAGASTGMLNHHFANRQELLTQTLVFVTERSHARYGKAIEGMPAGALRLEALLESVLGEDDEAIETWHVWIAAYGEAIRSPELRHTIHERLEEWFELYTVALEGVVPLHERDPIPWTWRLDALLVGLVIQGLTSEPGLTGERIRQEIMRMALAAAGEPLADLAPPPSR